MAETRLGASLFSSWSQQDIRELVGALPALHLARLLRAVAGLSVCPPEGDPLSNHPAVACGHHLRARTSCLNSTPICMENDLGTTKVIFHAV